MLTLRQMSCASASLVLLLAGTGTPACAGAWLQEEARSQIIFANTFTSAARRFDTQGKPVPAGGFSKQESAIAVERGLSGDVTLLAGLSARSLTFPTETTAARLAAGTITGGAKVKVWSQDATILSIQGTVQLNGERSFAGPLRRMDAPAEADLRLNLGHGFQLSPWFSENAWQSFAELQLAYRWRGGANPDEVRLDATLGTRPLPHLLLMLQSFNTQAIQTNRRFGEGRSNQHKLQASAVYDLSQNWSLQVGVFSSVRGRNTLREQGAQLAWWRRL